jgi:hypothetical protein
VVARKYQHVLSRKILIIVDKGKRNPLTFQATLLRLQISVHHHAHHLSHQVKTQSVKPSSVNVHLQYHDFICSFCLVIGGSTSSEEHEAHSVPSYILPRGTSLTNVQNKKLEKKVQAICSEIPIYGCVIKTTNISGEHQHMVREDFCSPTDIPLQMHVF